MRVIKNKIAKRFDALTGSAPTGNLFFQPKLNLNQPGGQNEQEAEQVADNVPSMQTGQQPFFKSNPISISGLQRKCKDCEDEEKMQRKENSPQPTEANDEVSSYINSLSSRGSPLPGSVKSFFEPRFERDFSDVRIHNDTEAAKSSQSVNALAYTIGNNIVFNRDQFSPESDGGKKLIAHELTHVVQQGKSISTKKIQRTNTFFGPGSTGSPTDWKKQVADADTPAKKAALVKTALGSSITVVDKTNDSTSDKSPTAAHLTAYTQSAPVINFDDGLNSKSSPVDKRSLAPNAGYTLHSGSSFYVILGPLSIKDSDFYATVVIANHEFDHVNQTLSGSTLAGNESEVDAWTSTFLREFHRTYILGNIGGAGTNCYVQSINEFMPLQFYYQKTDVSATQRDAAATRIKAYYTGTIAPHAAHIKVFKFWIHKMLKDSSYKDLVTRLNTDLSLGVVDTDPLKDSRQFPCAGITTATFSGPPSLGSPAFPAPPAKKP